MKIRLLLDVIVRKGSAVFKLLSSKDESLLIRRDTFLILDLCLDIFDGVRLLNIEGDCFSSEGFHEDLHCYLFVRINYFLFLRPPFYINQLKPTI
jgi:hypothetical protein